MHKMDFLANSWVSCCWVILEFDDASLRIAPGAGNYITRTYVLFRTKFEKRPSFDFLSVLYTRGYFHASPTWLSLLGCFQGFFSEQACSLVFPHQGRLVLALYRLTLPNGYFLLWFYHGFFFRSSLTGIFNVVYSTPAFYACRSHVCCLIFNMVYSPLFLTWSNPPLHFYTSRYLVKLCMMLAVQSCVRGGQMGGSVRCVQRRRRDEWAAGSYTFPGGRWQGASRRWRGRWDRRRSRRCGWRFRFGWGAQAGRLSCLHLNVGRRMARF